MGQMTLLYPFLAFFLLHAEEVVAYGFRNCIQSMGDPGYFKCMQRFLTDIARAVDDLPRNASVVNASHNLIRTLPPGSFRHLPKLKVLHLSFNKIEVIEDGAFQGLDHLETLNLSCNDLGNLSKEVFGGLSSLVLLLLHNNKLGTIQKDTFNPLRSLQNLQLQFNSLGSFEEVVLSLRQLANLETLNMCNNNLTSLRSASQLPTSLSRLMLANNSLHGLDCSEADFLRNVKFLDLSFNQIFNASSFAAVRLGNVSHLKLVGNHLDVLHLLNVSDLHPHSLDYSGLGLNRRSQLTKVCHYLKQSNLSLFLNLQSNRLRNLSSDAFLACPPIRLLDLSRNRLRSVTFVQTLNVTVQSHLETLVVEHNLLNRLQSRPHSSPLKELKTISYRFNRILSVGFWAFHYAPNLEVLHLNINNIAFLHKQALKGLTHLKELRLDNNFLTDLYSTSFRDLRDLKTLNLRNNHVSVLFPRIFQKLGKLSILDLGGNNIHRLTRTSFEGLRNLSNLYLDGNHIEHISPRYFYPVQETLQVLDLRSNKIHYISMKSHSQPPFMYLRKVYDLKLQAQQPYGLKIIPPKFFKGLVSLRNLYLSENKILSMAPDAFDDLGQLEYLTLVDSTNGMGNFPPGIFKNLRNLTSIDLENAGVRTLTSEVFGNLSSLRFLQLGKNELQTINNSVIEKLTSLQYLDLRKCPLSCTCNNIWFQKWLFNDQVQVVYLYNYSCNSGQQSSYVYSFDTHVCFQDVGLYLFSVIFPALLLQMALPVLYHHSYWYLRYHIYILRAWVHDHWRRSKGENYKFDAFVSYNSTDEGWVLEHLVPSLEKGGDPSFHLCLHHRDFQPGKYIIDNIVEGIHNSRHTICVISRSYLQSEWCSMEIQLASYRLFDELKDVLIPVFLETIPDWELSAYHRMRKVMLKKTYMMWPLDPDAQKLFWAKLRMALMSSYSELEEKEATYRFDEEGKLLAETTSKMV